MIQLVHILQPKLELLTWSRLIEGFFSLEGRVCETAARKRSEERIGVDQTMTSFTKKKKLLPSKLFLSDDRDANY